MLFPFLSDQETTARFVLGLDYNDRRTDRGNSWAVDATAAVIGAVDRMAASVSRARRRRQAIGALSGLDDRLLRDIGIYRAEIPEAVDGKPYLSESAPATWSAPRAGRAKDGAANKLPLAA